MHRRIAILFLLLPGMAFGQAITHGPVLGRAGAHEMSVWARTNVPWAFYVAYGTEAGRLDQKSPVAHTELEHDNAAWVTLKELKADTKYFYEVREIKNHLPALGGSFRTLPDAADLVDKTLNPRGLFNFRFEIGCCNNQRPGNGGGPTQPAFQTMLEKLQDNIYFAIQNGDFIYEEKRDHTVDAWLKQVQAKEAPAILKMAPTLAGVWENYKYYYDRSANLRAWHRNVPSFFTFDDHELLNDVWGAGQPGIRERRALFRDIGVRAWYDYLGWSNHVPFTQAASFGIAELKNGADVLVDGSADFTKLDLKQASTLHVHWGLPTAGVDKNELDAEKPGEPNAGVYGIREVLDKHRLRIHPAAIADARASYSIGRRNYWKLRVGNCDIWFLDTRSHRDMHDLADPRKKGISMIGAEQRAWLMDGMKASDADFHFVVSTVTLMIPHTGGGYVRAQNKDDAWTVFIEERERLIDFWDKLGKPVLVMTGDLHNSFAIQVTDNVWEFACGPHNSNNHLAGDEAGRPANGAYDSQGRKCNIRWSTHYRDDIPRAEAAYPFYCVVQVNNVYNNPLKLGEKRWIAFPKPQVVLQYFDGRTGELHYAESIVAK
jgi:phosphodiesterase/alkaline phosphatase D-like protein